MNTKLEQAASLAAKYEQILRPRGYHIALSGSALYGGGGDKDDFDFHIYPHVTKQMPKLHLDDILLLLPVKQNRMELTLAEDTYPNQFVRTVRICTDETGVRVDFFFWRLNHDSISP